MREVVWGTQKNRTGSRARTYSSSGRVVLEAGKVLVDLRIGGLPISPPNLNEACQAEELEGIFCDELYIASGRAK